MRWLYPLLLILASVYDARYLNVSDRVHLSIMILAVKQAADTVYRHPSSLIPLYGELIFSVLLVTGLLVIATYTDCMGGGDIKFILSNLMYVGFLSGIRAIFVSCILMLLLHGKFKTRMPMIPYLSLGFGIIFWLQSGRRDF